MSEEKLLQLLAAARNLGKPENLYTFKYVLAELKQAIKEYENED